MHLEVEGVTSISHQECWTHPISAFLYVCFCVFFLIPTCLRQVNGSFHAEESYSFHLVLFS
jgi:hypothetical protein